MRRTLVVLIGACLLASNTTLAFNPVYELSPDKKEELDKAGVGVKYSIIQNDPDNLKYRFVVTARAPERPALYIEISHAIRKGDLLDVLASWKATKGLCTAKFVVSKADLPNSIIMIDRMYTNKYGVTSPTGGYTLKPGEFAKHKQYKQLIQGTKKTDEKVQPKNAPDKK